MTTGSTLKTNLLAGLAAFVVMAVAFFVFSAGGDESAKVDVAADSTAASVASATTEAASADTTAVQESTAVAESTAVEEVDAAPATFSNLPTITIDELPFEAIETLLLIDEGGPYPYRQDDGTFQNREGILPDQPMGHYREYTVDTPGSPDRGARRIVSGADGERYYTDDHYDSFREITS